MRHAVNQRKEEGARACCEPNCTELSSRLTKHSINFGLCSAAVFYSIHTCWIIAFLLEMDI
jgi:hypothetical protein